MLNIAEYADGTRRVAIRTEVTLTAWTIAACIAAEIAPYQGGSRGVTDEYRADLRDLTKTRVEQLVREDVRVFGESTCYRADDIPSEVVELAEQRVLELFPGFAE